jgi:hypothetical protein
MSTSVTYRIVLAAFLALCFASSASAQVKVEVGDLKETRRTDGFFNNLEIDLKVSGPSLKNAKAARVIVDKASDDSGKNLIGEKAKEKSFKEISSFGLESEDSATLEVTLTNTDRRATTVKDLSGVIELFVPTRDPQAVISIPNFQNAIGKPLSNASLRSAGVGITVWTKEIFDARKKAEEDRLNKEIEAKAKKAEKSGDPSDAAEALGQGLAAIFGSMFSSFAQMEPNDLAFNVADPRSKLVAIEFEDPIGKKIEHHGKTTIGGDPKTMIFSFGEKLPPQTRMKIFLLTVRSVSRTPFKVNGVPLP